MGLPAARVSDNHVCPMFTAFVPHVGGPIAAPSMPNVLIGGLPAAGVGSACTCTGPPDAITTGAFNVLIGGRPAARMGDSCAHGGKVAVGLPNVLIGMAGAASLGAPGASMGLGMVGIGASGMPCPSCLADGKNSGSMGLKY